MTFLAFLTNAASIVGALTPLITVGISEAEKRFGSGHGTEKLKHAVSHVENAAGTIKVLADHAEAVKPLIEPLINATVSAANVGAKKSKRRRSKKGLR